MRELTDMVRRAGRGGMGITQIEDTIIDPADLSDDEKSALWLAAFVELDRSAQRRVARESLAIVRPQRAWLN